MQGDYTPLADIRPNFDLPGLEAWLLDAIENVTPIAREVRDRQGTWYSLRIRPYKTRDNRIDVQAHLAKLSDPDRLIALIKELTRRDG